MRRFAAQLRYTHREKTLTPDTWPYDVPVNRGIGVGDSACPATGPEAVPLRTTAAPDVRVRASVALGKIESRPPRRLGLPSRGAELDFSSPPRLRGWVWVTCANPPAQWVRGAMRDALPRRPHGWFGGGGVPASPGYPFIPGGAPAVFRNTIHTHTHTRAGFTEQSAWHAVAGYIYIGPHWQLCSRGALRARNGAGCTRACSAVFARACRASQARSRAAARGLRAM